MIPNTTPLIRLLCIEILISIFFIPKSFGETNPSSTQRSDAVTLAPIVISTQRVLISESRTAQNVLIYMLQNLQELPGDNLSETLEYVPGVDISVNPKFNLSSAVTIQGSESRQVLIMVDDIPFNTQLSGQVNPAKIPVDNIQRLEVIKGASSSSWGSALGGVINVITKDAGDTLIPHGRLTNSFAEFHTDKHILELDGKAAGIGYYFMGSYFETDGTRSRSKAEENKYFGKFAYAFNEETKLETSFGYSGAEVRDGVLPTNRINDTPYYARYGKIKLSSKRPSAGVNAAVKYNDQEITTDVYNATTGARLSSTVSHDVYGGLSLNGNMQLRERDVLVYGADFDRHELKSNNYLNSSKKISMQAPYANYTLGAGAADVNAGMRYDHNDVFGDQASPSLGLVYHLEDSGHTRLKAQVSRAFNAPPLLWIYNDDPAWMVGANPGLKAERALVYEWGAETQLFSRIKTDLNFYWADIKDAIATRFDTSRSVFIKDNFKKFRNQGAELNLQYRLNESWRFDAGSAFNHVVNRETHQIVRGRGVARESFLLSSHYEGKGGFGLHLYGRYNRWDTEAEYEPNDRKFIFDIQLTQDRTLNKYLDLQVFLTLYNVANSKYWANKNLPLPRRYFEGGMTVEF